MPCLCHRSAMPFTQRSADAILKDMAVPVAANKCEPIAPAVQRYGPALDALATQRPPCFAPVPKPRADDWLAVRTEPGQSFARYLRIAMGRAQPHGRYDTIALVLLGSELPLDTVQQAQRYISAFYGIRVAVLGPVPVTPGKGVRVCPPQPGMPTQVVAEDLMAVAATAVKDAPDVQRRCIATMGVTLLDLALDAAGDNWVYGVARPMEYQGTFSLARFHPSFCGESVPPEQVPSVIRRRCCKVLSHELGHLFGLKHCINFTCLMNGANHARELNRQPLIECPACTKKLCQTIPWLLEHRYAAIVDVCTELGFDAEAEFVRQHLLPAAEAAAAASPPPAATTEPRAAKRTSSQRPVPRAAAVRAR